MKKVEEMRKPIFVVMVLLMMTTIVTPSNIRQDISNNRVKNFSEWSTPVKLDASVNSTADDLSAVLSNDGLSLYFTSNRKGSAGEDIWISRRLNANAAWGKPVNLGAVVNSASMDRLRSISSDGLILLFQSNRPGGIGGNDIWVSTRNNPNDDFGWGTPINIGTVVNTDTNEVAANYLFGGQERNDQLFFSSSRAGGIGDADIYTSEIASGNFSQPINVFELNSPYTEACFWVRDDGLEIFFSSTRAALNDDLNSFDLWVSTRANIFDNWSPPARLGAAINTENYREVNPSLSADWQTMYFTSNRGSGFGGNDIYVTTRRRLRTN